MLILAVAALAATAWATFLDLNEEPPAPPPPIRLTFPVPGGSDLGTTDQPLDAAISPDEQRVAFVATTGGMPRLWLRDLDSEDARPLAGTEGASLPAWKRGGGVVSFFAGGRLRQVAVASGEIGDLADAPSPAGATWLLDGSLLAGSQSGPLRRFRSGTSTDATTLQPGDRGHIFPASSDGAAFVYLAVRDDGSRVVRLVQDGDRGDLTTASARAQLVGDQLVHARDGVLVAQRVDPETGRLTGRPAALAPSVAVSDSGYAAFAASPRLLIVAAASERLRELVWFDEAGRREAALGDAGELWQIRLSPDDRHAAVTLTDPLLKTLDIVTMATDATGDRRKLTLALAADTDPVWSPDGERVLFRSMEDGRPKLFLRKAHDPDAPIEPGPASAGDDTPSDWRGGSVLVASSDGRRNADIETIDIARGGRASVAATGFNETSPRWSPDGRSVALVSDESGQPDVYAVRGGTRVRVSFGGGTRPRWAADGRSLYFLRGEQIVRADLQGAGFTTRVVATIPGIRDFDVAHRSRRLLVLLSTAAPGPAPFGIVNWTTPLASLQAPRARE